MLENAGAAEGVLTQGDLRAIQEGAAHIEPSGERYPAELQRFIDR